MVIGRRLDIPGTMLGAGNIDKYNEYKQGAPELLWQKRQRYNGTAIFLNLNKEPMDDIRVRRAMGLLIKEEDLIIGATGDLMFGISGAGLLHPAFGLPKEEVAKLMGWDNLYQERVAEARKLMAEAGYPDGFKMNMMAAGSGTTASAGEMLVFADILRKTLKIESDVHSGLGSIEL